MLKGSFHIGPFTIEPRRTPGFYDVWYGPKLIRERIYAEGDTRSAVLDEIQDNFLSNYIRELREKTTIYSIAIERNGVRVGGFACESAAFPGMTAGLTDDRSEYWLVSDGRLYSLDVTLNECIALCEKHRAAPRGWIANLLRAEVTTTDAEAWQAPSSWEIRHVVGEGSLTGITGAAAAALVGMTSQNFRKYLAADGASTRQKISYAAWHLLLKKLDVLR